MKITDDVALGDTNPSDTPTPKDFDFEAWLQGARAPRTAVRIFQRPDLQARVDEIQALAADDDLTDEQAAALLVEFEQVKADLLASSLIVTIEQKAPDWVKRFRTDEITERGGKVAPGTADPKDQDLALPVNIAQAAEQVISPAMTAEQIGRLYEVNPAAVAAIVTAMHVLNQTGGASRIESPDFSRRRSAGSRT